MKIKVKCINEFKSSWQFIDEFKGKVKFIKNHIYDAEKYEQFPFDTDDYKIEYIRVLVKPTTLKRIKNTMSSNYRHIDSIIFELKRYDENPSFGRVVENECYNFDQFFEIIE